MRSSLSQRLALTVGLPVAALVIGVLVVASLRSFERVREQTAVLTREMAQTHAARLDQTLSRASMVPRLLAQVVESGVLRTPAELESFLRQAVERTPEGYGSCIAFEPGSLLAEEPLYAPYFYHREGKVEFVQLGTPKYAYPEQEWFARPRDAAKAIWTEPYYDDGGGDALMTTYAVPFWRAEGFWGIATIDIALAQLAAETARIRVGRTGYAFLVSRRGRVLAFPDASKVMTAQLSDLNPDLARPMMAGEQGFIKTRDPSVGRDAWVAYVPIQNGDLALGIVYPRAEALEEAVGLRRELLMLGGLALAVLVIALAMASRGIAQPICQLAAAARRVSEGHLDHGVEVRAGTSEVRDLSRAFHKMTRDLQMRMRELQYTTTVQQRLEGELAAARRIQMSLVPKRFPAFPRRLEIDLHAVLKPARAVGGDFYDWFFVDRDCLAFLVGDVAGKGVAAALFMAVSKTLVKSHAAQAASPEDLLALVNDRLCEEGDLGMFVSLAYGILNLRSGEVHLCNAGHPPPLRLRASGGLEPLDGHSGVALGAWRGMRYTASTWQLAPGDTLVLYSDGITEALNPEEQFYTAARLQTILRDLSAGSAEVVTRGVLADVRAFAREHEQADDITVLALKWMGVGEG